MEDFQVIHTYSRAQAIEDGVLVDVSKLAKEMGFRFPVAVTQAVWHGITVPDEQAKALGESETGRLWDILWVLFFAIKRGPNGSILPFEWLATFNGEQSLVPLKAVVGPGDDFEPVITIMKRNED